MCAYNTLVLIFLNGSITLIVDLKLYEGMFFYFPPPGLIASQLW